MEAAPIITATGTERRMEYEIAGKEDIEELYALQLRAFESEAEMIGSRSVPALMESREENRADFDHWTVLVRRDEAGRIIGAVRYRKLGDHIDVGRLMVAPEHRNRGVASDLMRAVEEMTRENTFELYTCTKSYSNIRLYEQLGYRIFKEERGKRDLSFAYMRKTIENGKAELY
jgi:GNAT superfamily N-acetyltransferase